MFSTAKSATIQVNVRFKIQIDEDTLLGVLSGRVNPDPWIAHFHSLITEVPTPCVQKLMLEHGVGKKRLGIICSKMPSSYAKACTAKINDLAIPA